MVLKKNLKILCLPLDFESNFEYIWGMKKTIDIFQFTHFRKYLDEYQAARVQTDPEFTRAGVCALLGLPKTRSYFNDIVKGKKLSGRMIPKFVEVLGLNKKEAKYFETMVNFDQAKTTTERNAFFDELIKQHPDPHTILDEDAYEYYNHWYNSVLFTALDVMDVSDDSKTDLPESLRGNFEAFLGIACTHWLCAQKRGWLLEKFARFGEQWGLQQ